MPGSSRRPDPSGPSAGASTSSGATASSSGWPGGRASVRAVSAGRAQQLGAPTGVRLRHLLEEAGGVYVKLGQIAATRVDLVPPEICGRAGPPAEPGPGRTHASGCARCIEAELGCPVEQAFAEFEWEPLAAASIGQTYRARLQTGEAVVVKVQRPDIEEIMERDLAALGLVADLVQRRTAFGQGVRSGEVLSQFARSLRAELDFRREADATSEMRALLGPDSRRPRAQGLRRPVHPPADGA